MTVAEKIKQTAAVKAFDYIGKDPEHNIPKVLDKIKALDDSGSLNDHIAGIKKNFEDPDNGMHKLALSLFSDIDPDQLKKLYEEMAVNSMYLGATRMPYAPFLFGGICGMVPAIVLATVLGDAVRVPGSPQFWWAIGIYAVVLAGAGFGFWEWKRRSEAGPA